MHAGDFMARVLACTAHAQSQWAGLLDASKNMAVRMASRKTSSLAKGITGRSIPVPTGEYTVGCVDLMHKLEGDNDGLLVKLFYPTIPKIQAGGAVPGCQYTKWMPHVKYTKTTFDFIKAMVPGLSSNAMDVFAGKFNGPHIEPNVLKPPPSLSVLQILVLLHLRVPLSSEGTYHH